MCGLTGVYSLNRPIDGLDIKSMTDVIRHRGPDDEGYVLYNPKTKRYRTFFGDDSVRKDTRYIGQVRPVVNSIFLGHRRLSIIDLSQAGHQPMANRDGTLLIVFNGELYNYVEIREELKCKGYIFNTATDTEVIIESYQEWGVECLEKFDGMWSFVILDIKNNILFGSRDRFGVKPLYYYLDNELFAFSSEIKSLILLPFIEKGINEGTLYDYLLWGITEQEEQTFLKNIKKLPHSNYFIFDFDLKRIELKKYYQPVYNQSMGSFEEKKYNIFCEKIRELIFDGIRKRLRSDVPIGTCLSGGIDSSSIVVSIKEILKSEKIFNVDQKQKVFTVCYDEIEIDESKYASAVVEKVDCEWFRVFPSSEELLRDIYSLVHIQDEPFYSTSIYAQYRVMQLAKERGVKVVLDGQGGDEIFTGYKPYYAAFFTELIKNRKLNVLFSEAGKISNSSVHIMEVVGLIVKQLVAKFCNAKIQEMLNKAIYHYDKYIHKDYFIENRHRDTITKKYVCFSINELSYKLLNNNYLQALLRYEDRNSMAHGIEARTPFSDNLDLIEYLLNIPSIYKIHNGWSKCLVRDSLKGLLPYKVMCRKDKTGFDTPQGRWIKEQKEALREIFTISDPFINTKKIYDEFDQIMQASSNTELAKLWRYINVLLWNSIFRVY